MSERKVGVGEHLVEIREQVSGVVLRALTYPQQLREDLQEAWSSVHKARLFSVGAGVGFIIIGGAAIAAHFIIGPERVPGMIISGTTSVIFGAFHLSGLYKRFGVI